METSYLDSKTFGVGQLITQRKLFKVPEHQRNFSWDLSNIQQFFEDVTNAMEGHDPDYFIGLVVLMGPRDGAWQILDGQQRLATVTMIYSAIRHWLASREDYGKDAEQIESEFIGVRQLGGGYHPRLSLNVENQDTFLEMVIKKFPSDAIDRSLKDVPKGSSNRLLVEAVHECRNMVKAYAEAGASSSDEQAERLFNLSSYLEEHVKVVALDVLSEANAFMIFEALNARGNELSSLDLVKNHIFGSVPVGDLQLVRPHWLSMSERIEEKNADDFLRVFWTSRFGRVQKHHLYNQVKETYFGPKGAKQLVKQLATAADHYTALDDPQNELWLSYGSICRQRIHTLILLGNKQVRIPIMAAISQFDEQQMAHLLWVLIVLTIRYQVVGRRRTGALEISSARLANNISSGKLRTAKALEDSITHILPTDEEFRADFLRFSDKKGSRVLYFLAELELTHRQFKKCDVAGIDQVARQAQEAGVNLILPKNPTDGWKRVVEEDPDILTERLSRLGNQCLVEPALVPDLAHTKSFDSAAELYKRSQFRLTSNIGVEFHEWNRHAIEARQATLADLALNTWTIHAGPQRGT
jgi:hypothetical protein